MGILEEHGLSIKYDIQSHIDYEFRKLKAEYSHLIADYPTGLVQFSKVVKCPLSSRNMEIV